MGNSEKEKKVSSGERGKSMPLGGSQRIKVSSSSFQILPSPGSNTCMCTQIVDG